MNPSFTQTLVLPPWLMEKASPSRCTCPTLGHLGPSMVCHHHRRLASHRVSPHLCPFLSRPLALSLISVSPSQKSCSLLPLICALFCPNRQSHPTSSHRWVHPRCHRLVGNLVSVHCLLPLYGTPCMEMRCGVWLPHFFLGYLQLTLVFGQLISETLSLLFGKSWWFFILKDTIFVVSCYAPVERFYWWNNYSTSYSCVCVVWLVTT